VKRIIFGHHKCASTSLNRFAVGLAELSGLSWRYFGNPEFQHLEEEIAKADQAVLSVGASKASAIPAESDFRAIHLIRHPLDIIVSAYYSHRYSHPIEGWPDLAEHRKKLAKVSKAEGFMLEMDFWPTRVTLEELNVWDYSRPEIYESRFEEYTTNVAETMLRWVEHLRLMKHGRGGPPWKERWNQLTIRRRLPSVMRLRVGSLSRTSVLKIADDLNFEKLAHNRRLGETDTRSHYRSGKAEQWKNEMGQEHINTFLKKFPNLLESTGYTLD